jgi:hypothetical protein
VLRITILKSRQGVTIKLEGSVVGPWVEEVHRTWMCLLPSLGSKRLRVDLCGVTFVNARGKQLLTDMKKGGAAFKADTAMTRSVVEEIERSA